MLGSVLALGLLLGLKHSLEADHLSTVITLASRSSAPHALKVAASWGLGHAGALTVMGGLLVALGATLPAPLAHAFEIGVGLTLIALGIGVLRRLRRERVHAHVHDHDGARHLHLHAHGERAQEAAAEIAAKRAADRDAHAAARHQHAHGPSLFGKSIFVGGVHGLAGSAVVTLLALPSGSLPRALLSLAVFGAGTVLGMMALTTVISLPLKLTARRAERAYFALQCSLSLVDLALGSWIVLQHARL